MGILVHCSTLRYAVIQASSSNGRPECVVVTYQDETCLRDLIAAPSICGLGFVSREEAVADLEASITHAARSNCGPRTNAMLHPGDECGETAGWQGLAKHRIVRLPMLHAAVVAIVSLFYSKNLISAIIRVVLGVPI